MKSYTITVNGNVYDVTVEETGSTASAPVRPATKAAPAAKAAPTPAPAASEQKEALRLQLQCQVKFYQLVLTLDRQ